MVILIVGITSFKIIIAGSVEGSFVLGNVAPNLDSSIPNQSWDMNTDNTNIDLDDYFNDGNGDAITYNFSEGNHPNINITIGAGNVITFSQPGRWIGVEYVVFTANDSLLTLDSNNVTLEVVSANTVPTIQTYTPSSTTPTMTEEQTQDFNISFTDAENTTVTVTWSLNGTVVSEENITLNIGESYINTSSYSLVGNYSLSGLRQISVVVSDGALTATLPSWIINVTDVNRAPTFTTTIEDIAVKQGETFVIDSLDNYVSDPDVDLGDSLDYNHITVESPSNISVTIDSITHEVTFKPRSVFTGTEDIYFKVTDASNEFNYSNNITITVSAVNIDAASTPSRGSNKGNDCENYYRCDKWGKCNPLTNTRMRVCEDLAECRVMLNPPEEVERCDFIESCENNWKDSNEEGVDCGGDCPSCYTCYDGEQNQEETGIDCGGPCKACATCDDGIKNCQRLDEDTLLCEEDVDCGGPCDSCELFSRSIIPGLIGSIAVLMIMSLAGIFVWKKEKILGMLKPKKKEKIVSPEQITLRELTKINRDLNKVDKGFKSMSTKELLKSLSGLINQIIKYKFELGSYHTKKELVEKMNQIKKNPITKELILNMYSKMYHMKFSGEDIEKEKLLQFIKQAKVINSLEMVKFNDDKIEKNR
jgi:hypothetical protein